MDLPEPENVERAMADLSSELTRAGQELAAAAVRDPEITARTLREKAREAASRLLRQREFTEPVARVLTGLVQEFAARLLAALPNETHVVERPAPVVPAELSEEVAREVAERLLEPDAARMQDRPEVEAAGESQDVLQRSITALGLSRRTRFLLEEEGIDTVARLASKESDWLLEIRGFREVNLLDVRQRLAAHGLKLASDPAPWAPEPASPDFLTQDIEVLDLGPQRHAGLRRGGIRTIQDLVRETEEEVLECGNIGRDTLHLIRTKLAEKGLKLRGE